VQIDEILLNFTTDNNALCLNVCVTDRGRNIHDTWLLLIFIVRYKLLLIYFNVAEAVLKLIFLYSDDIEIPKLWDSLFRKMLPSCRL
jgi:hypothetical protein